MRIALILDLSTATAHPNADGVNKLLAFATGISHTAGTGAPLPSFALNGGSHRMTYRKDTIATDVTYANRRLQNFTSWTTATPTSPP